MRIGCRIWVRPFITQFCFHWPEWGSSVLKLKCRNNTTMLITSNSGICHLTDEMFFRGMQYYSTKIPIIQALTGIFMPMFEFCGARISARLVLNGKWEALSEPKFTLARDKRRAQQQFRAICSSFLLSICFCFRSQAAVCSSRTHSHIYNYKLALQTAIYESTYKPAESDTHTNYVMSSFA